MLPCQHHLARARQPKKTSVVMSKFILFDMALPMFNLFHIDGGTDDHVDGSSVGNDAPGVLEDS